MLIRTIECDDGLIAIYAEEGVYEGKLIGTADAVSLYQVTRNEKECRGRLGFAWGLMTAAGVEPHEFVKYPIMGDRYGSPLVVGRAL